MAKPYFIIKIEKVVAVKKEETMRVGPFREDLTRTESVFQDDLLPEEVVDVMGFIIDRRKGRYHGR